MAIRIKSRWHNEGADRSPEEIGGAIAFIAWRIATDRAITLHSEHFVYRDDPQRLAVIAEYLAYEAQIADRLIQGLVDDPARGAIITALVMKLADHFRDNASELLGPGDHASSFVSLFNERSGEYAEFNFDETGPSFPLLRHLGNAIQQVMGLEEQANRWVIDQVMDVDGPGIYQQLARAIKNLFD